MPSSRLTPPLRISRLRTALLAGAICLLVASLATALILMREYDRLRRDHGERLAVTATLMAERLDLGLRAWARDVGLLARFGAFAQEPPDRAATRQLLEDLKARSPEFSWIGFAGADGRVIAATGGLLEGVDVAARPWFAPGLQGLHLGDVHPAVLLARLLPESEGGANAYFVDAAAPVRRADGTAIGVIAGHLNWRWAEGVQQEAATLSAERPTPELIILGADGLVLLGPEALRGQRLSDTGNPPAGARTSGWFEDTTAGMLTGFARTQGTPDHPGLGWVTLARRDLAVVREALWPLATLLALGALAVGIAGGVLAQAAMGRVGKALRSLTGGGGSSDPTEELDRVADTLRQLRDSAHRDPLTGLLNRAGFAAWRAANPAAEQRCAMLALDLDGFKPINDRHGHAAGDAVLAAIGQWLTANTRAEDCAVRTGGDEFVLCLHGAAESAEAAAIEVTARFQAALAEGLPTSAGRMTLGCSIGMAIVPRDAPDIDQAIAVADAQLYRVKHSRTDRPQRAAAG